MDEEVDGQEVTADLFSCHVGVCFIKTANVPDMHRKMENSLLG